MRRRAVIAAGTAGLLVTGVFIAGSTDAPPASPQLGPQTARLVGAGMAAKLAGTGAVRAGTRLLAQAATATRAVPYRAVQVISWLAPGSSAAWLGSGADRVSVDLSHRTGQPPDVVLGLSPTLVGLLDAHYLAVYTGQGSAAGRPASVVEVCRRDGSVAARFWLDDATKLPLRRELFNSRAHLISTDGLAGLKITAGAAKPASWGTSGFAGASLTPARPAAAPSPAASASPATGGSAAARARPWADRLGRTQLAALRTGGWPVPAAMPGGLTLFGASESGTSSGRVVDLAYSDGLSVISLFLQRGRLPTALPGWRQAELGGHPVYLRNPAEPDLTWSTGGYVYTMVAGAPAPVIASVVDSLSHQRRPGFWARMDRGMRRVLSWVNPFR